jgi:predicted nuclease of predicted toxin-antitoxin system
MKLLFDQNISHRLISLIQDILPEAKQVRQIGLENSTDKQIWEYAKENDYIIVTFDADFYDFSLVWGHPPKHLIIAVSYEVRNLNNPNTRNQIPL